MTVPKFAFDEKSPSRSLGVFDYRPSPDKFFIVGNDGRVLLTVQADGKVEGELEDAGEAAKAFVKFLRTELRFEVSPDEISL